MKRIALALVLLAQAPAARPPMTCERLIGEIYVSKAREIDQLQQQLQELATSLAQAQAELAKLKGAPEAK